MGKLSDMYGKLFIISTLVVQLPLTRDLYECGRDGTLVFVPQFSNALARWYSSLFCGGFEQSF
jgi:hypothetical protein